MTRRFCFSLFACALVVAGTPTVFSLQQGRSEALATRLQQRYDGIKDFEADFVQTIRSSVLRTKSEGQGHLYVKRPGRMKWVYATPDRQEIFWDGQKVVTYFPDDKVANVTEVSADSGSASLLFLAGKGNILRDFVPSAAESTVAGTVGLRLTPRHPEPGYEYLILMIEEKSAQLRGLITRGNQGDETTTTFRNLKENGGLRDTLFVFTPPRGVELFTPGAAR